jgi:hypothetical protein
MGSLREKLFGKAASLRDKLSEAIVGSYEVKKLNDEQNVVTDAPNILERIGGKRTEEYVVKKNEPIPEQQMPPTQTLDPEFAETKIESLPEIQKPREESLLNKVRAKIEDVFDGEEEQVVPVDAVEIKAEDDAPEGSDVQRINDKLYTLPKAQISMPNVKDKHKEPIIKGATTIGVEPTIIAKILKGEGLNSTPEQLEEARKREGAIGPGQHRKIFYDEWNPEFKERFGRDYDKKNLEDVAIVTSMAIKHYMDKYGTLEAALVAYNKGESVVKEYIEDPNVSLEDDPYVIGFKNRE